MERGVISCLYTGEMSLSITEHKSWLNMCIYAYTVCGRATTAEDIFSDAQSNCYILQALHYEGLYAFDVHERNQFLMHMHKHKPAQQML